jgi:RNA polymerase sigma-70 factor, ECF subfamily
MAAEKKAINGLALRLVTESRCHGSDTGALMNSSEDLIVRARAGDHEAFRLIFERYARPVLSFVYDIVGERDLAEEITQETFVRTYHKLGELRDDKRFSTWLFGIGKNVAREALRSRHRTRNLIPNDELLLLEREDQSESPADHLLRKELNIAMHVALRSLDEDRRIVFALKVFQQHTYEEIVEITGFSLAKVKTDLHRARKEMRHRIRPYLEKKQNEM